MKKYENHLVGIRIKFSNQMSQCFWQTFNVSQAFELGVYQVHLARISRSETLHKIIHSVHQALDTRNHAITLSQHEVRSVCQTFTLLVLCTG